MALKQARSHKGRTYVVSNIANASRSSSTNLLATPCRTSGELRAKIHQPPLGIFPATLAINGLDQLSVKPAIGKIHSADQNSVWVRFVLRVGIE
jgi:hypothetical protein